GLRCAGGCSCGAGPAGRAGTGRPRRGRDRPGRASGMDDKSRERALRVTIFGRVFVGGSDGDLGASQLRGWVYERIDADRAVGLAGRQTDRLTEDLRRPAKMLPQGIELTGRDLRRLLGARLLV